jgi:hypothetical protein
VRPRKVSLNAPERARQAAGAKRGG